MAVFADLLKTANGAIKKYGQPQGALALAAASVSELVMVDLTLLSYDKIALAD